MKIIIAPDSFKDSISSFKAIKSIKTGLRKYLPNADLIEIPISDGGEGLLDAIICNVGGEKHQIFIKDSQGKRLSLYYATLKDRKTAVIESAVSLGANKENILKRSSYNLGILIKQLLDKGFREMIIGLGGSGTNDAGIGMLEALGTKFYDENANRIRGLPKNLCNITRFDISSMDKRVAKCRIITLADVINPISGINGATKIYAKQKGASPKEINFLEKSILHLSDLIKQQFGWEIKDEIMLGAAGGTAFALKYFLKSDLKLGMEYMIDITNFENRIKSANWVISGEGKYDKQTKYGKAVAGIKELCKKYDIPLIIFTASSENILNNNENNIIDISSSEFTKKFSMKNAEKLLTYYSTFISWMIYNKNK